MRWIAFLLASSGLAFATPREDLASPSQAVRDEAAGEIRKTFVLPDRKAWDELVASIKIGDTRASVMGHLKPLNAKPVGAAAGGGGTTESYRLDGAWVVWVASAHDSRKSGDEATTVIKIWLEERLEEVWIKPPEAFTGIWTTYYINGERSHEIHYVDGRNFGSFTAFRPDGSKAYVSDHGRDGQAMEYTGYFPSGKIECRGFLQDGKNVGTWTRYNEDGTVQSSQEYPEQGK